MKKEFGIAIQLAFFVLSNTLIVLAMRVAGIPADFWSALCLAFFAVFVNMVFLGVSFECVREGDSPLLCTLPQFTLPGLAWLLALLKSPPSVHLEGVPWQLVIQTAFVVASAVLTVLAIILRSLKLAGCAAVLTSITIFTIVLSS